MLIAFNGDCVKVNHKSVLNIAIQHTVKRSVDVLYLDDFNVRSYLVISTKIKHLLRCIDAANE
jgi:hypothetical protein